VCGNTELLADLDRGGITLASWRDLRDAQRTG